MLKLYQASSGMFMHSVNFCIGLQAKSNILFKLKLKTNYIAYMQTFEYGF